MPVATKPAAGAAPTSTTDVPTTGRWPWLAFGAVAVVFLAILLYVGRDLLFFLDEWDFVRFRRDPTLDNLLRPHVGHLSVVPVAIYELFFWVFGIADYTPYRVLVGLLHVATITLAFVYLRRRVSPVVAVGAASVLLFFGAAWQDLLWTFQIGFVISVLAGVGAFVLLDSTHPRSDALAAACVGIALASSSIGIPVAAGVGLELLWRRARDRWWVVGVPVLLYGAWYAAYGESFSKGRDDWPNAGDIGPIDMVRFAVETGGATVGALVGVGSGPGQVLLLGVAIVAAIGINRADADRRPRLLALAAVPVTFWLILGISRAGIQPPTASRYLYAGAVFVVLLVAESIRGIRLPAVALAALLAVGAWSVAWNLDRLLEGRDELAAVAQSTRVELGAISLGGRGLDAAYDAQRDPPPTDVRIWMAAFDDLGFPGASPDEIAASPDAERTRGDAFLVHAAGIRLAAPGPVAGPAPSVSRGGPAEADGDSCVVLRASGEPVDAEVVPRSPALRLEALGGPVQLRIRAFADGYYTGDDAWATVRTGRTRGLWLPDLPAATWALGVRSLSGARVCAVAEPPGGPDIGAARRG